MAEVGAGICMRMFSNWDAAAFRKSCDQAQLSADKKVQELSRGMGMRLSLACALSHRPRLLVLDPGPASVSGPGDRLAQ